MDIFLFISVFNFSQCFMVFYLLLSLFLSESCFCIFCKKKFKFWFLHSWLLVYRNDIPIDFLFFYIAVLPDFFGRLLRAL